VTTPTCGVCEKGLRAGENPRRVRLTAEDMADQKYPARKVPGLYSACPECFDNYLAVIATRLGKTPETMAQHDTV
jgi:hypothetical protein